MTLVFDKENLVRCLQSAITLLFVYAFLFRPTLGVGTCGNGILEEEEECDCGSVSECRDPCCRALVCRLREWAECSNLEPCCRECKYKLKWEICREAENECDLPEYCTGKESSCPTDLFRLDGKNCWQEAGYCLHGHCQTHQQQCSEYFQDRMVIPASDPCYRSANGEGSEAGHCGDARACSKSDALCGVLQCVENISANDPSDLSLGNHTQIGHSCPLLSSSNPLVQDFTKCGTGKVCRNQKCVKLLAISVGLSKCNEDEHCSGHGDCTNQLTCHCHRDWEGVSCSNPETYITSPASTPRSVILSEIPWTRSPHEGAKLHFGPGYGLDNRMGMIFAIAVVSISITFFLCALVYCYLFSSPAPKPSQSTDSQGDEYSLDTTISRPPNQTCKESSSPTNMHVIVNVEETNGKVGQTADIASCQSDTDQHDFHESSNVKNLDPPTVVEANQVQQVT